MKNLFRVSIGFVISGFCLWLVLKNFDWVQMKQAMVGGDWVWLLPASVVYITGFFSRNIRWHFIVNPIAPVSRLKLFPTMAFGYLVNNLLPARAGEFARTYLASKLIKKPFTTTFATVVADRLLDFIGLIFLILVALPILGTQNLPLKKISLIIVAGIAFVAIFLVLSQKISSSAKKDNQPEWKKKFLALIKTFGDGFRSFKSAKQGLCAFVGTLFVWTCEIMTVVLFSRIFGLDLNVNQAAALMVGTSVGAMIPAAPGYVGTYELFALKSLAIMGFLEAQALPFVLVLHLFHLTGTSIFGFPYLFKLGEIKKAITQKEKMA